MHRLEENKKEDALYGRYADATYLPKLASFGLDAPIEISQRSSFNLRSFLACTCLVPQVRHTQPSLGWALSAKGIGVLGMQAAHKHTRRSTQCKQRSWFDVARCPFTSRYSSHTCSKIKPRTPFATQTANKPTVQLNTNQCENAPTEPRTTPRSASELMPRTLSAGRRRTPSRDHARTVLWTTSVHTLKAL